MKKYLISTVTIMVVLAVAWAAFGQRQDRPARPPGRQGQAMFQLLSPEEAAQMREKWQNMSEEEREKFRAQMRERWQKLSDEEKEKLRAQMRERFGPGRRGLGREEQLKAIKAVEEQLARLKAALETAGPRERRPFRELSEQERAKLREKFMKAREERQKALGTIIAQIARLQGQGQPPREGERFIIINTGELKAIHQLAVKEKAKETTRSLARLIARATGLRGAAIGPRRPRPTTPTPRTPEGRRGTRRPRRPGGPGGPEGRH